MYNVYDEPMRDTSEDQETGWIRPDLPPFRETPDVAENDYGMGALGDLGAIMDQIPQQGRHHLREALADAGSRPAIISLLSQPDPGAALAKQFEEDVTEFAYPTGKPIIFKKLAAQFGAKVKDAEDAMMEALPTKPTTEGRDAADIFQTADDPKGALTHYYTQIGIEALAPDWFEQQLDGVDAYDDEDELSEDEPEGFGLGLTKKAKKIMKGVAIGAAIAAGAVLTGGVILPAVLPAISAALPAVLGAVGTVGTALFKKRAAAAGADPAWPGGRPVTTLEEPTTEQKQASIDWGAFAKTALDVWTVSQTDPAQAEGYKTQMVKYLVARGLGQTEAAQKVAEALAQVAASKGPTPAAPAPPPGYPQPPGPTTISVTAPGVPPGVPYAAPAAVPTPVAPGMPGWVVPAALVAVLAFSGGFRGGGGRRTRRNPRRRRRSRRRTYRRRRA